MKKFILHVLFAALLIVQFTPVLGKTIIAPITYLKPILGTNTYSLPDRNSSLLVKNCGFHRNNLAQHWRPSEKQISIIDKQVELELAKIEPESEPFKLIKLYFGLADTQKEKRVYAYIFPASMNDKLMTNFGEDKFVCLKLKSVIEFNLDNFELKLIKHNMINASR